MNNNMFKYIKKYGNKTFEEMPVTEVDILIFSQIPYLNFNNIFKSEEECIKISDLWTNAINQNLNPKGISHKNAFKIMDELSTSKRYKDLLVKNYVYHLSKDTQFGAISIIVPNDSLYVVFEGTDGTLWGWKEDFKLTYAYPVEAQLLATSYLNKVIKLTGPNVVVCGHSKGGNLALVGAMRTNIFKKHKIKNIYSFDGPGLKKEEFKSLNYKLVRSKIINIIPNLSLVGILLEQENLNVIKSRGIGLLQHDPATWQVDDDKLIEAVQDNLSIRLDENINSWLEKHNYQEREEIIEGVFSIFEDAGINNFYDKQTNKIELIQKIIKSTLDMDKETKEIILTSIKLLVTDFGTDLINDGKKELKELEEKYLEAKEKIIKHLDKIK